MSIFNQPSFWRLFWHYALYFVVVKIIVCTFFLERTIDCCAMSCACAWEVGTGCILAAINKGFNSGIWQVKICLFHNNMQKSTLINGNGMHETRECIDILWVILMQISLWNLCWMINLVSIDDTPSSKLCIITHNCFFVAVIFLCTVMEPCFGNQAAQVWI